MAAVGTRWWTLQERLFLLSVMICCSTFILTRRASAALTIMQGRIVTSGQADVRVFPVVGIATVELGGNDASRPTYFFECITTRNNGSGITWTRLSAQNPFEVVDIPSGSAGKRLEAGRIDYPDLDIYTCSDQYSNDVASINITAFNPAIMAAEETVGVVQGLTVELEVYVSGYPVPTSSQITWSDPNGNELSDATAGVELQDGGRRLILSNVQTRQAGQYECTVLLSSSPYMGATAYIQLNVYEPSMIETQPLESTNVEEWSEVELNCSASGVPLPMIRWERVGGAEVPVEAIYNYSSSGNIVTSTLTFERIRYDHQGRYRCVADNMETNPATSNDADISVSPVLRLEDATMRRVNDLYFVEDQSSVRLECFGSGNLQWNSSTGLEIPVATSGNIYQSYDSTRDALSLVIRNFTSITTSTYTCITDLTDTLNSPITEAVLVTSFNPAVVIRSPVQYVLAGHSTTLEARVFASPAESAVVQWYHEGRLIDDANEADYTINSRGDIRMLTVDSVSEDEIGRYTVEVILNGVNVMDQISLEFPVRPSATITPSPIYVTEGDPVSIVCEARGSGPLTVSWSMSDGSPLPMDVQEDGNILFIASASSSSHPGTYLCSVSNIAGTEQAEADLTVFYGPTSVITYNNMTSTPDQGLYLIFDENVRGPSILCSGSGNLPPTVRWVRENGRGLPSGISQSVQSNGNVLLRWQRPMEFTDSGSYHCQASNNVRNSSVSLEILVQIEPTINSIYPFNSIISQDSDTHSFTVPVNYIGRTLVCTAKGWPAPVVEWRKDGLHLDSGVVSEPNAMSATVSARLTWTRGFIESDAGRYECVVHKPNTEVALTSQVVQLNAGPPAPTLPPVPCSIEQQSIDFQIRIFGTSCGSWDGVRGEDIANELASVVRTECGCTIDESSLQVFGSAQCSDNIDGAAVFRGQIQTNSQEDTEQIFCTLFSWQQKMPLIRVNDQLRTVDTTCSFRASSSPDSEECAVPVDSPPAFGTVQIAITVAALIAGIILVLVVVLVIVLIGCCCYRHRTGSKDFSVGVEGGDHTYSRPSFSRYDPHGVSRQGTTEEEPVYSTLVTQGAMEVPRHLENIPLSQFPSDSSENLIPGESIDAGTLPLKSAPRTKPAEAYQIPVSSQENLASPALGSVNNFQAMKRQASASTTSGYHSTSHINRSSPVQKIPLPRPSNSSTEEGSNVMISATSPWNDYEHIDGDDAFSPNSSFCDSPIPVPGKVLQGLGRQQSAASMGGGGGGMRISPKSSQRQHGNAGSMSASVPVGINPPQLGPSVFAVVEEDSRDEFNTTTRVAASHQILNNGRPERNEMTTSLQQSRRVGGGGGGGSHSPTGSAGSSSPHMMKQALMKQFQSVDHMASRPRIAGRESNCSEAPPPYTSRPSSEAVPNSDSADSSMMDNAAYGGIGDGQNRAWYQASDFSLDSSLPSTMSPAPNTTSMAGEHHIQPYAMIHNEHIPYPTNMTSTKKLNNESSAIITRRSSNNSQQQKPAFQVQPPVQPYAEPIRSSVASLGHAQDSPTFFEVVV